MGVPFGNLNDGRSITFHRSQNSALPANFSSVYVFSHVTYTMNISDSSSYESLVVCSPIDPQEMLTGTRARRAALHHHSSCIHFDGPVGEGPTLLKRRVSSLCSGCGVVFLPGEVVVMMGSQVDGFASGARCTALWFFFLESGSFSGVSLSPHTVFHFVRVRLYAIVTRGFGFERGV